MLIKARADLVPGPKTSSSATQTPHPQPPDTVPGLLNLLQGFPGLQGLPEPPKVSQGPLKILVTSWVEVQRAIVCADPACACCFGAVLCASCTLLSAQLLLWATGSHSAEPPGVGQKRVSVRHLQIFATSCTSHIGLPELIYVCLQPLRLKIAFPPCPTVCRALACIAWSQTLSACEARACV